jgi:hypothetical protein
VPHLLFRVWITHLWPRRSTNAFQWRRHGPSRREAPVPHSPKTLVSLGLERPRSLNPVENKTDSQRNRGQPSRNRCVIRCPIFNEGRPRSRGSAEFFRRLVRPCAVTPCGRSAGSPTPRRRRLPRAMPPFSSTLRPPSAIHGRSDSVLGVTRHRSDPPLVERAGLDQRKQPRTAIETEFVERVARGHGIKAPLPFEHDLHGGQRTVFFD